MKVITIVLLMCLISSIETKLVISADKLNFSFKDVIHSIIYIILKKGNNHLAAVVVQENCSHFSNEIFKQIHLLEYLPTLTIQNYANNTLGLVEMFPDKYLLSGIIAVPKVVFWFAEKNDDDFWSLLGQFRETFLGNPRTPFIIIITSLDQKEINIFKEQCLRTWKEYHILNLVVIAFNKGPSTKYENQNYFISHNSSAWFFNQFQNNGSFLELSKLLRKKSKGDIFSNKLNDINNYEIKVTKPRTAYGLKAGEIKSEYNGMKVLVKSMNGSMVKIPWCSQDNVLINSGRKNCSGGKYIIPDIFGSLFIKHTNNIFKSTDSQLQSCIKFLVPKAQRIPQYMNIILPFTKGTWGAIFSCIPIITLLWKIFRSDASWEIATLLETFRIFISGATVFVPVYSNQKLFVILVLLASLVLMNAYQGSLTSYLTIPHYYPDIDTLEQLEETGIGIVIPQVEGTSEFIKVIMENIDPNDEFLKTLVERLHVAPDVKSGVDMVAFNRTMAYADSSIITNIIMQLNDYYKDGYPLMHTMKECPYKMHLAAHFPIVSPFENKLNVILRRLFEAGIVDKWIRDDEYEITLSSRNRGKAVALKPLGLGHVQTSFYILIGGLALSFISLLCENLVFILLKKI